METPEPTTLQDYLNRNNKLVRFDHKPAWIRRMNFTEADRFLARQDTTDSIYSNGSFMPRGSGDAA
jgi:hypothetical protein